MTKLFTTLLMSFSLSIHAQQESRLIDSVSGGISFERGLSWQQVLEKAKALNKHIFVDCYATWCMPCRYMADSIFTKQETGDFMNRNFINIALQMDTTEKDPPAVRERYKDAAGIMGKYNVTALPTFLFFTPDGECIYRSTGSFPNPASFIARVAQALDPDEQYFFLLEQYNRGRKEPTFVARLLEAAKKSKDYEMVERLEKEK
jgi:thiol:disulfide interchange protein